MADLDPFATIDSAKAQAMIDDAEAQAMLIAPCISDLEVDSPKFAAVKAILRGAVLRWHDAGTGAVQTQTAGPFAQTVQYQARRGMFWPTEIKNLQAVCADRATSSKAFDVDMAPSVGLGGHAPFCSLFFGGPSCSCGANLTNYSYPLWE